MSGQGYAIGGATTPGAAAGVPFLPQTPLGVTQRAMKLTLDFLVQGDEGRDLVSGTALTAVAGALEDQATDALILRDPPAVLDTGALQMTGGQSWDAWNSSVNDVSTESAMLAVTFYLTAPNSSGAAQNIVGKRLVDGMELFLDTSQHVRCDARSSDGTLVTVELPGSFDAGRWHTVICAIDRSRPSGTGGGQIVLSGTNESTSRAANTAAADIPVAANYSNTSVWAVGAQRIGVSVDAKFLHVATASGIQIEGRDFWSMAGELAKSIWAEPVYGGVTP